MQQLPGFVQLLGDLLLAHDDEALESVLTRCDIINSQPEDTKTGTESQSDSMLNPYSAGTQLRAAQNLRY